MCVFERERGRMSERVRKRERKREKEREERDLEKWVTRVKAGFAFVGAPIDVSITSQRRHNITPYIISFGWFKANLILLRFSWTSCIMN